MDRTPFPGTGIFQQVACVVILTLVGLILHIARRKRALNAGEATPAVDRFPWLLQFPPSRRHTLAQLKLKGSTGPYEHIQPEVLQKCALPSAHTADLGRDDLYTPTGFSTQDIRAIGRFPDYSVLTGVRYPKPCGAQFDINKAIFRPFRPFRWTYHQTMAHYKFDPDWWVELEQSYVWVMKQRQQLREKHGELIFYSDPGSELACRELMEILVQFLVKRYPQYFSLENDNTILENRLLDTRTDLLKTPPL
jgi:hypothetical protein